MIKSAIKIRRMRRADAPAMARLMRDLVVFHGDQPKSTARHFTAHCLGSRRLVDAWLARVAGKPAGFIVTYDWFNFVRGKITRTIDLLYIDAEYRRSSMGRLLVAAAAEDALAKGCMRIKVGARTENKAANKFYQKLGFTQRSDNSTYYTIEGGGLSSLTRPTGRLT